MDKEEPNFNIWGAAKVEQIYKKQQEKQASRSWKRTTGNN